MTGLTSRAIVIFARAMGLLLFAVVVGCARSSMTSRSLSTAEPTGNVIQVTRAAHDHVLTNANVFSPDSRWIVYDVRTRQGNVFDGDRIERVHVETGAVETIFRGKDGAFCGVASYSPAEDRIAFIYGPERPTGEFSYGASRRQGLLVDLPTLMTSRLDARDLSSPFTPGALRGGTHVHIFSLDGSMVSSTYEDHILEQLPADVAGDRNTRTIAVSVFGKPVQVDAAHSRNHDGIAFSVVVAATTHAPEPGTDQIGRAFEEGWIGTDGYVRADGSRQRRALAFQGNVAAPDGRTVSEVFVVDLPEDLTRASEQPLEGDATHRPAPPLGCVQRRLTRTTDRKFPGIQGPRHWLRSSPDGSRIAFLMKDDVGVVQLWTISPNGGEPVQLTRNATPIASAFTWSPDGSAIAHVMDGSVCITDAGTGQTRRLTPRATDDAAPRPEACVFSPDGKRIAFVAPVTQASATFDQVFVVRVHDSK